MSRIEQNCTAIDAADGAAIERFDSPTHDFWVFKDGIPPTLRYDPAALTPGLQFDADMAVAFRRFAAHLERFLHLKGLPASAPVGHCPEEVVLQNRALGGLLEFYVPVSPARLQALSNLDRDGRGLIRPTDQKVMVGTTELTLAVVTLPVLDSLSSPVAREGLRDFLRETRRHYDGLLAGARVDLTALPLPVRNFYRLTAWPAITYEVPMSRNRFGVLSSFDPSRTFLTDSGEVINQYQKIVFTIDFDRLLSERAYREQFRIFADGVIDSLTGALDKAGLTGESLPHEVQNFYALVEAARVVDPEIKLAEGLTLGTFPVSRARLTSIWIYELDSRDTHELFGGASVLTYPRYRAFVRARPSTDPAVKSLDEALEYVQDGLEVDSHDSFELKFTPEGGTTKSWEFTVEAKRRRGSRQLSITVRCVLDEPTLDVTWTGMMESADQIPPMTIERIESMEPFERHNLTPEDILALAIRRIGPRIIETNEGTYELDLGVQFESGHRKPKDLAEARKWYESAAGRGNAEAQHHLGRFYEDGLGGLTADLGKAVEWYEKSADQGYPPADVDLARLEREESTRAIR